MPRKNLAMDHDINLRSYLSRFIGARVRRRARLTGLAARLWIAALFAVTTASLPAAVTEAWVQRYNAPVTNSQDQAFKVIVDASGDIIVTGTTDDHTTDQDFLTMKYSGVNGLLIWQWRHSGPGYGHDVPNGLAVDATGNVVVVGISGGAFYTTKYAATDGSLLWERRTNGVARAVAVDATGNVVVTGSTTGTGNHPDYYTVKYAAVDGALLWDRRYEGPSQFDDVATAVVVDASGNVVVTGSSYGTGGQTDYYTAKYAGADGAVLWEKRYNGPANSFDEGQAVAVDASGNVLVTGRSSNGSNRDYYTAKYAAADGSLVWEKRYDGPANGNDYATAVAVDANGDVAVTGYSDGSGSSTDYYTVKYAAADGELLWEKRYNGTANSEDQPVTVVVDASGDVIVTGFSDGRINGVFTRNDYYTAKYAAADGALLWEVRVNTPINGSEDANALALDPSGDVVVTGTFFDRNGNADWYTAKYAGTNGAQLLEMRYNGLDNTGEEVRAVAVDFSGNVAVTGYRRNDTFNLDFYTAKYAATNGALLWENRYDGNGDNDYGHAIAVDTNGNVVVTGASRNGSGNLDYYTAKYASTDGALLWERRYNGSLGDADEPAGVALNASGDVFVTGFSSGRTNGTASLDYYTAKYAAADGALLWEKRYNGPANSDDAATALVVDATGNVIVTGRSFNGSNNDYYTVKYAAANGAQLWEKRYHGTGNDRDEAQAIAVDANANVAVTGLSDGSGSGLDYYTAKYAAGDGTLLWEKRYNGPDNRGDQGKAIAMDASGNVIVTGFSTDVSGFVGDYYTAKYAAADGALLWETRFNGPENKDDRASAATVDASGDVIVTGTSASSTFDLYTAKYAGTNGALLWEKRYDGPAHGEEVSPGPHALALTPDGSVAITGSSDGDFTSGTIYDYVTILYRELAVLDARGVKLNVLAELAAQRASATRSTDQERLDKAIERLTSATELSLWLDENRPLPESGRRIFNLENDAVQKLNRLFDDRRSSVSDELLADWIARLVQVDRLLAEISVEDAVANGGEPLKVAKFRQQIARGNIAANLGRPRIAIVRYRNAWRRAIQLQGNTDR